MANCIILINFIHKEWFLYFTVEVHFQLSSQMSYIWHPFFFSFSLPILYFSSSSSFTFPLCPFSAFLIFPSLSQSGPSKPCCMAAIFLKWPKLTSSVLDKGFKHLVDSCAKFVKAANKICDCFQYSIISSP